MYLFFHSENDKDRIKIMIHFGSIFWNGDKNLLLTKSHFSLCLLPPDWPIDGSETSDWWNDVTTLSPLSGEWLKWVYSSHGCLCCPEEARAGAGLSMYSLFLGCRSPIITL